MGVLLLFSGLSSHSQSLKLHSHVGFGVFTNTEYNSGVSPVTFIGLDLFDKVGIEYGYSWSLNNDPTQFNNYIYGNSSSWTAGQFTHLISTYFITNRDEGTAIVMGAGVALTNIYKATNDFVIERNINPYFKVGLDHNFTKNWGGQLNFQIGGFKSITFGIKRSL